MDALPLDDFLKRLDNTETEIHNMVSYGLLYSKNDCCGEPMKLVLKRKRYTWECMHCSSTKSIYRNSLFEVLYCTTFFCCIKELICDSKIFHSILYFVFQIQLKNWLTIIFYFAKDLQNYKIANLMPQMSPKTINNCIVILRDSVSYKWEKFWRI